MFRVSVHVLLRHPSKNDMTRTLPLLSPPSVRGAPRWDSRRVADAQGVIGEVVSFLEPQAVLAYSMACKTADDVLRQVLNVFYIQLLWSCGRERPTVAE